MGLAISFPERKVPSFSAGKIEQVKILRRIKYRTSDEEIRLARLEDEKVEFLSWKALQENGANHCIILKLVLYCNTICILNRFSEWAGLWAKHHPLFGYFVRGGRNKILKYLFKV